MNKQVENATRSLTAGKPEHMRSSILPDRPWQEISFDLLDISNGEQLMVVDYYSRWLEAILLKKMVYNT